MRADAGRDADASDDAPCLCRRRPPPNARVRRHGPVRCPRWCTAAHSPVVATLVVEITGDRGHAAWATWSCCASRVAHTTTPTSSSRPSVASVQDVNTAVPGTSRSIPAQGRRCRTRPGTCSVRSPPAIASGAPPADSQQYQQGDQRDRPASNGPETRSCAPDPTDTSQQGVGCQRMRGQSGSLG